MSPRTSTATRWCSTASAPATPGRSLRRRTLTLIAATSCPHPSGSSASTTPTRCSTMRSRRRSSKSKTRCAKSRSYSPTRSPVCCAKRAWTCWYLVRALSTSRPGPTSGRGVMGPLQSTCSRTCRRLSTRTPLSQLSTSPLPRCALSRVRRQTSLTCAPIAYRRHGLPLGARRTAKRCSS